MAHAGGSLLEVSDVRVLNRASPTGGHGEPVADGGPLVTPPVVFDLTGVEPAMFSE